MIFKRSNEVTDKRYKKSLPSKGPYLFADTTIIPDKITHKIVNMLG